MGCLWWPLLLTKTPSILMTLRGTVKPSVQAPLGAPPRSSQGHIHPGGAPGICSLLDSSHLQPPFETIGWVTMN